jgi:hypothetical protein
VCLKAAVLLDWIHIFVPGKTRTPFFCTCTTLLVLNLLFYVICVVVLNSTYNSHDLATLPSRKDVLVSATVVNLISDVAMVAIVQQVIWSLHMSVENKIGVSLVFATGILYVPSCFLKYGPFEQLCPATILIPMLGCSSCVAGACRVYTTIDFDKGTDMTNAAFPMTLWATAEMTSEFVVLCTPMETKVFSSIVIRNKIRAVLRSWTGRTKSRETADLTSPYREIKNTNEPTLQS